MRILPEIVLLYPRHRIVTRSSVCLVLLVVGGGVGRRIVLCLVVVVVRLSPRYHAGRLDARDCQLLSPSLLGIFVLEREDEVEEVGRARARPLAFSVPGTADGQDLQPVVLGHLDLWGRRKKKKKKKKKRETM